MVIACNTASAFALPAMRERFGELPVIGVVEPGAAAACRATRNQRIAVIGTEATIRGGAYQQAIQRLLPEATVRAQPAQLLVALAEEGWTDGDVALAAARRYLTPLFSMPAAPDTLVLGCTHFPMLLMPIRATLQSEVAIVDSALTTAVAVREQLAAGESCREPRITGAASPPTVFLATDGVERFARVGARFLTQPIAAADVELVDL